MRLSRKAVSLRETIEEAFLFSQDDQGIARYFHVPQYEIAAMRTRWQEELAEQKEQATSDEEWGSTELRDAIQGLFSRWERKHGFQEGAAQILVPAGYNP
jgi:hypothetical protein